MTQQKHFFLLFFISVLIISCKVSNDPMRSKTRQLQKGVIKEDTSYIYSLPYAFNSAHKLVQGYFSRFSHKNRAALDFKMRKGTAVFSARNGIIVRAKENGNKGGLNKKYRKDGNYIIVQHPDSSRAGYWHLQQDGAVVNIGETIVQGQLIGYSGKTGYALFPHLHFLVWRYDKEGHWQQTPTRFKTSKGIHYLRPFRRYRNSNL